MLLNICHSQLKLNHATVSLPLSCSLADEFVGMIEEYPYLGLPLYTKEFRTLHLMPMGLRS